MIKILVVGCGQIGSRHLQGILKLKVAKEVFGVDPGKESLRTAEQRCQEIDPHQKVVFASSVDEIKEKDFDFIFIATSSKNRLELIQDLFKKVKSKYVILEKVVFTKETDFEIAQSLFQKQKSRVYTNCSKRLMPFYQEIKKNTPTQSQIQMSISGGGIGIACNVIHYLDLMRFYTGKNIQNFSVLSGAKVIPSKRSGYFEIDGTVLAQYADGSYLLLNSQEQNDPWTIQLTTQTHQYLFQEFKDYKVYRKRETIDWKSFDYSFGFQSDLTKIIIEEILTTDNSTLVSLEETYQDHKQMLKAFNTFFNNHGISTDDGCPIT